MKISVAQTRPFAGDIQKNVDTHLNMIDLAATQGAACIIFPELSLTGYEPTLASALATTPADPIFDSFQKISDVRSISIGVGMPIRSDAGILISMILFQPGQVRQAYAKQYLHEDEYPYFVCGTNPLLFTIDHYKIAPAICYESLVPEHSEKAFQAGADIYIASVAKSAKGIAKAYAHFPAVARQFSMTVLMANCVGRCDDFESVGNTAVWNNQGALVGQLNDTTEGILIIDTDTQELIEKTL